MNNGGNLMNNTRHVIPKDDKWQVKKSGATRASGVFSTQKEAIASGSKQEQIKRGL